MKPTYKYKIGDKVKLKPGSGFVGDSNTLSVMIPDTEENIEAMAYPEPCMIHVGDKSGCLEWPTLWGTTPDGQHVGLYHVGECQIIGLAQSEDQ